MSFDANEGLTNPTCIFYQRKVWISEIIYGK